MNGVFVSYRRDDTAGHAGRIYDHLVRAFGRHHVFFDVETIHVGTDFVATIHDVLKDCDVVLVIIGPQWLRSMHDTHSGDAELHRDFVHLEVASALSSGVSVLPVLVNGAAAPDASELPADIRALSSVHAVTIRSNRFTEDVEALIHDVRQFGARTENIRIKHARAQREKAVVTAWAVITAFLLIGLPMLFEAWALSFVHSPVRYEASGGLVGSTIGLVSGCMLCIVRRKSLPGVVVVLYALGCAVQVLIFFGCLTSLQQGTWEFYRGT